MDLSKETLSEINSIINREYEIVERRKFTALTVGVAYIIKKVLFLHTRFGETILVTLYDSSKEETFETFLPKRVAETLTENITEAMNQSNGKYTLTYLGQSPGIVAGRNSRALLNFGCLE